jgi:hypothetical protein
MEIALFSVFLYFGTFGVDKESGFLRQNEKQNGRKNNTSRDKKEVPV